MWKVAVHLVTPRDPPRSALPGKQLQIRAWAASLDDGIELVWLAGVLFFAHTNDVNLPPARLKGAEVSFHAEQHKLRDISKIESYAPPVRSTILADFVPDDVGLVLEAPTGMLCFTLSQTNEVLYLKPQPAIMSRASLKSAFGHQR